MIADVSVSSGYLPYRYVPSRSVERDQFYGRGALLRDTLQELAEERGPHARRFLGRRRQGKTSALLALGWLLQCVEDRSLVPTRAASGSDEAGHTLGDLAVALHREGLFDAVRAARPRPILPVYLDLRAIRSDQELGQRLTQRIDSLSRQHRYARRLRAGTMLAEDLRDVLEEVGESWDLALLLDDPGAAPGAARLLLDLRSRVERPPALYFSTGVRPDATLADEVPVFPLGNLPRAAVDAMLARGGLSELAVAEIRQRAGGHPFYLQILGHARQNGLADAEPQLAAAVAADLEELPDEEQAWLASGEPLAEPAPVGAGLLERCGYTERQAGAWRVREGVLREHLGRRTPRPTASPAARCRVALRRYDAPTRQRYGQLELPNAAPINLGAQNYLLLYLLCAARQVPALALQGEDAKYPMFLSLALCGAEHGYLNPRGLLSNLRKALRDGEDEGEDERTAWLPKGRGGYRLGEDLEVQQCDHPFGHIRVLRRLDLVQAYRVWSVARAELMAMVREAAGGGGRGRGLRMTVRGTADGMFPHHPYVVHVEALRTGSDEVEARLGPIPLTEAQATAFRHWRDVHDEGEGVISRGALERELRQANLAPVSASELCRPFDVLGLRDGGSVLRDGKRWSSEWLPPPDTPVDFPTAPRWLDLSLINGEGGAPYTVEELLRELEE